MFPVYSGSSFLGLDCCWKAILWRVMRMRVIKRCPLFATAPAACERFQYSQAQFCKDHLFMTLVQLRLNSVRFAARFLNCHRLKMRSILIHNHPYELKARGGEIDPYKQRRKWWNWGRKGEGLCRGDKSGMHARIGFGGRNKGRTGALPLFY